MELDHIKVASVCHSILSNTSFIFEDRRDAANLLFIIACRPDIQPATGDAGSSKSTRVSIRIVDQNAETYAEVDRDIYDEMCDYLRHSQKINAIKLLRNACGCGLKEAKDTVETNWNYRL